MEIEVELAHGYIEAREIPVELGSFTAATDVAFEILQSFEGSGKTYFAVYLVLLKHRNMKNNKCFPSIKTIADETKIGVRTIKEALDALSNNGYLSINSGMRGIANNYYFPKEWFYKYFEDDINQRLASRRKSPLKSDRVLKAEKKLEEANKKIAELESALTKVRDRDIDLAMKANGYSIDDLSTDDPFDFS